ncbi:MAG: hypothetical protein WCF58_16765 [Syntrophobacteraceae bacterium]
MRHSKFPIRKEGIFRSGEEIKGLRGGVLEYAAQASPKINAARTEKAPFRMETRLMSPKIASLMSNPDRSKNVDLSERT